MLQRILNRLSNVSSITFKSLYLVGQIFVETNISFLSTHDSLIHFQTAFSFKYIFAVSISLYQIFNASLTLFSVSSGVSEKVQIHKDGIFIQLLRVIKN